MHAFPDVSLLITHYNRTESLENLLKTFNSLNCVFGSIVVSDDGSNQSHIDKLQELQQYYLFKLIKSPINKGLGNNINKGQDAIETPYTLYIQEDFEPSHDFPFKFEKAITFMNADENLDIVRFYAYFSYPYLKDFSEDFSEMYINNFALNYNKIYFYSDHPHLRRSNFFDKFGRYTEGMKGDITEYKMCISFIQNKGKGLFYNDYANLLTQKNSQNEPSTMTRSSWKYSQNYTIKLIRDIYRQIKYNLDILTMKPLKK